MPATSISRPSEIGSPGVDELIELEVQRPKVRPFDVPVGLLSHQGEVDELDEHALQLGDDLAVVRVDRQVEAGDLWCGHGDVLFVSEVANSVACDG